MPSAAEVERAIRKTAADMGVPELANLLVAISRRESGLGQNPVGDNGDSIGPFQENINGRGKGLSREQRMDPVASTKRAIAEIKTVMRQSPNADPGTIAILAQRPREDLRANYRADINAQLQRAGAQTTDGTRPTTGGRRAPSAAAQAATSRARTNAAAFGGTYVMPVDGTVTNAYGGKQTYSEGKTTDIGSVNNGVDIATKAGTTVRAPVGGVVKKIYDTRYDDRKGNRNADENSGWGGQIVIQGDDGKEHRLSHAQYGSIQVQEGQRVEAGQPTHKVGMSGNATGPHVDWEKWSGGKSEDALKSALMPSSAGAQAYQAALARQRAARPAPTTGGTPDSDTGTGDAAGGTDVGATASIDPGTGAARPNAALAQAGQGLVNTYAGLIQKTERALDSERRKLIDLQEELVQLQSLKASGKGDTKRPDGTSVNNRITVLTGGSLSPGKGEIAKVEENIKDLDQQIDIYTERYGSASNTAAGRTKTPEELEQDKVQTEKLKTETALLKKRLEGTDPDDALRRTDLESQIASREAAIAAEDRRANIAAGQLQLEANRNPSVIRGTNARAALDEWNVQESRELMPFNIERIIAQTDVDEQQANVLRETLTPILEGKWTDIWAKQLLTPQELELGKANTDLTRQRANEIRVMLQANLEKTLSDAGVNRANITKIVQMLPLEIADLTATTQLRNAQTGLTTAQTGKTGEETRLTRYQADAEAERQRRSRYIEEQVRADPNMSIEKMEALALGQAYGMQEWATVYRAQLERQVATSQQHLETQRNQLTQQATDSNVRNQRMTEALGLEQNRVNQVNSATSALSPGQQGPMRRMAQLGAMAPLVGSEGLRGVAMQNRIGAGDLNPVQEAYRRFEEMVGGIRGTAPDVRMAPDVTAPPPIKIRFTPPEAAAVNNPAGDSTAPSNNPLGTTGGSTATATTETLAPTIAPITPGFTPPMSADEMRRLGMSRGRIGGV